MHKVLEIKFDETLWKFFEKNNISFAAVESFTGGAFAKEITSIPGASKYFKGSLVTYSNEIKQKLGVDISKGVINSNVAKQMALKGKKYFDVDYCISFTGNAGPDTMDQKPVGLAYISINSNTYELNLKKYGDRKNIIKKAVEIAIRYLINQIQTL